MPPQRQFQNNKAAASTSSQASKPDRFTPFLADIRLGLGSHWILYEECIEGILEAAAQRQDTTAWFEQLQRLVSGNDQVDRLLLAGSTEPRSRHSRWRRARGDPGSIEPRICCTIREPRA